MYEIPAVAWVLWAAAFVALELLALRTRGADTLSARIRELFKVKTPAGRAAFVVAAGVFIVWFVPHIVNG